MGPPDLVSYILVKRVLYLMRLNSKDSESFPTVVPAWGRRECWISKTNHCTVQTISWICGLVDNTNFLSLNGNAAQGYLFVAHDASCESRRHTERQCFILDLLERRRHVVG